MAATETASSLPFAFAWATSAFPDTPHTVPAAITGKGEAKSPDDAVDSAREVFTADTVVLPAGKLANPASCAEKEAWGERGSLISIFERGGSLISVWECGFEIDKRKETRQGPGWQLRAKKNNEVPPSPSLFASACPSFVSNRLPCFDLTDF